MMHHISKPNTMHKNTPKPHVRIKLLSIFYCFSFLFLRKKGCESKKMWPLTKVSDFVLA